MRFSIFFLLCFFIHFKLLSQSAELVVQNGHSKTIKALAFSPDGKWLASASEDNNVIIWDVVSGKEFRKLVGHQGDVASIVFSPDGKILASGGGKDASVIYWNWLEGKLLFQEKNALSNDVNAMAFSKDGKMLLAATYQEMKAWDIQTHQLLWHIDESRRGFNEKRLKHTVKTIVFSPDNKLIATGTANKDLQLWDLKGNLLKNIELANLDCLAESIIFSKDSKTLIHTGSMGKIMWRETTSGKLLKEINGLGSGSPCPSAFSPDLKYIITTCSQAVKIQSLETGKQILILEKGFGFHSALAYNIQNSVLAVAAVDDKERPIIHLYNPQTGVFLREMRGYPGRVTSLDFSKDNFKIAAGYYQRPTRIWDIHDNTGYKNYLEGTYSERGDIFSSVALSPDGKILYNSVQGRLFLWNTTNTQLIKAIFEGSQERRSIKISADGKKLLHLQGVTAKFWDAKTGDEIQALGKANLMTRSIAFSSDNKIAYAGGYQEIKRWDAQTFKELSPIKLDGYAWEIAPSVDGKYLCVKIQDLFLLDAITGNLHKRITYNTDETNLTYSPDGKYLATAHKDTILIRETNNYSIVYKLLGHTADVTALSFSSDMRYLASGSDDTSIKLWDLKTGKLVVTLIALDGEDFIMMTPDLYYLTTKDGTKGVAFRVGNRVLPFESFDLQFNRPDTVLQRIGYASPSLIDALKKAYHKRLKRLNFDDSRFNRDFNLPQITLLNTQIPLRTENKKLTIHFKATDLKYNLDRLHITINDTPIFGLNGIDVSKKKVKSLEQKLDLILSNGTNKIEIIAMNEHGVESIAESFEINYDGQAAISHLHIFTIGVSQYKNPKMNLNYARKDAEDLIQAFQNQQKLGEIKYYSLFDQDATTHNILNFKEKLNQTNVDDKVLIFFAGHGLLDDNLDYFLATYDINFSKPSEKGLLYEKLEGLLDAIPARNKILLIDACHSGEVDKDDLLVELKLAKNTEDGKIKSRSFEKEIKDEIETKKDNLSEEVKETESIDVEFDVGDAFGLENSFDLMKEMFADLRRGTGSTVISSAGGQEYALEGDAWKNGVFTYCLLSGLKTQKADLNGDGKVMLSELQKYLQKQVPALTDGQQQPTSRVENISNDFRIW